MKARTLSKILKLAAICLMLPANIYAETEEDDNVWYGFFGKTKLSESVSWWTETQLRFNLDESEMDQALIRTGALFPMADSETKQEFGLLYAYIQGGLSDSLQDRPVGADKEHRIAFQHSMYFLGLFENFSHRIRYEYRKLEAGSELSDRFRYLGRYNGPALSENLSLVVWDEIFLNTETNDNDEIDNLDRNRFFVGLRNGHAEYDFEFGYLNQWAPRDPLGKMDHVFVMYLFL